MGIDIEPDDTVHLHREVLIQMPLQQQQRYGINIWNVRRSPSRRCTLELNGSLGMGTYGCTGLTVTNNTSVLGHRRRLQRRHQERQPQGNLSYGKYTRLGAKIRTPFTQTGWTSKIERDILIRGTTSGIVIGANDYK